MMSDFREGGGLKRPQKNRIIEGKNRIKVGSKNDSKKLDIIYEWSLTVSTIFDRYDEFAIKQETRTVIDSEKTPTLQFTWTEMF